MKELNLLDAAQVSGGNQLLVAIGAGIAGNYVYESIGGKDGIDSAAGAVVDYFKEAWDNDPIVSMF